MNTVCLTLDEVRFSWPEPASVLAWRAWSCRLNEGVTAVVGGDSVGKTTLLRLLAGECVAQGGELVLHLAGQAPLAARAPGYRRQVASFLPDTVPADGALLARHFLAASAERYSQWSEAVLHHHLQGFALDAHLDKPLYALSAGMRRKLGLAAAFASQAPMLLLDDPFAALDRASIHHVLDTLDEYAQDATQVVVVAGYAVPDEVPLSAQLQLELGQNPRLA